MGSGLHSLSGTRALLRTAAGRRGGAHGHRESAHVLGRCTHLYPARCTTARACKYPHGRARVHRRAPLGEGAGARGSWGEVVLADALFGASAAERGAAAPPGAPPAPCRRCSLSRSPLPRSPDPSPALSPRVESSSSPAGPAQVSRWDVPVAGEGRGCSGARCAHEHLGRLSSHRV